MKKVPFIQLPKDFLERPLIDDMVQEGGATAVGAYVILLLYLSHRRDCVGSFSYPTLRMLSLVSHKSVRYVKNIILNYGQFRVDEKGMSFTCPDLQRSFRIPETIQRLFTDDDEEGSESDSKLNDNSSENDSKLNANSKFVRVPNIRARINRDKDKNERKKESTSSTQKKTAAIAADGFFNFGFNSSHPTKKGARRDGAGDATDGGDDKDGDGGGPAQAPPTRARAVQRKHNEALADEMMKDEEWLQSLTYITGVSLMTPEMRGTVKRKRDAVHFKTVTNSNDRTVTYDDREYPKYLYAGFLQLTPGYDKWDKEGNHYDWKGRPIPKDAPAQASATHYWDEEEHRWITPAHPKVKCS